MSDYTKELEVQVNGQRYISDKDIISYCVLQCEKFINTEDNWRYRFDEEFPKTFHREASVLSQLVFLKVFSKLSKEEYVAWDSINFTNKMNIKGVDISFDIMNNPNPSTKNYRRLGNIAKKYAASNLDEWIKLKYTIGNFSPIPNFCKHNKDVKKVRHLQHRHNDLAERWDSLLKECKENWEDYSCDLYPTFINYMKLTCQQIYFEDIYMDMVKKITDRDINNINDEEWLNWIEEWNDQLNNEQKEWDIIDFGKKDGEMENIEDVIKMICLLIEVRGRMIIALLRSNKEMPL